MTGSFGWWARLRGRSRSAPDRSLEADPSAAFERAITDLREQHRLVTAQAAEIIAAAAHEQHRLERAIAERERLAASARQAVTSADEATAQGRLDEGARWEATAEALAARIAMVEDEIADRRVAGAEADAAARRARAVAAQSAAAVRARILDHQRVLSDLDRARLQERFNLVMQQLEPSVEASGSSLVSAERAAKERLATAEALAELRAELPDARRVELEQELWMLDARDRVARFRRDGGPAIDATAVTATLGTSIVPEASTVTSDPSARATDPTS